MIVARRAQHSRSPRCRPCAARASRGPTARISARRRAASPGAPARRPRPARRRSRQRENAGVDLTRPVDHTAGLSGLDTPRHCQGRAFIRAMLIDAWLAEVLWLSDAQGELHADCHGLVLPVPEPNPASRRGCSGAWIAGGSRRCVADVARGAAATIQQLCAPSV